MTIEQLLDVVLLVIVIETLMPALAPKKYQSFLSQLLALKPGKIQNIAVILLSLALAGLLLL